MNLHRRGVVLKHRVLMGWTMKPVWRTWICFMLLGAQTLLVCKWAPPAAAHLLTRHPFHLRHEQARLANVLCSVTGALLAFWVCFPMPRISERLWKDGRSWQCWGRRHFEKIMYWQLSLQRPLKPPSFLPPRPKRPGGPFSTSLIGSTEPRTPWKPHKYPLYGFTDPEALKSHFYLRKF